MTGLSKELYSAILSMDAYNRDYGAYLSRHGTVQYIGDAKFVSNSNVLGTVNDAPNGPRRDESAGFFAAYYDVSNVGSFGAIDKVISYRGTDPTSWSAVALDMWTGWTLGAGFSGASQAGLAKEFYQKVLSNGTSTVDLYYDTPRLDVMLTGHSLGGGLAGFVGALSGAAVTAFDHMPFLSAAYADLAKTAQNANGGIFPSHLSDVGLRSLNTTKFDGYFIPGEALEFVRGGVGLSNIVINSLDQLFNGGIPQLVYNIIGNDNSVVALEAQLMTQPLANNVYLGTFNPVTLHSQALLVITMFGEEKFDDGAWNIAAPYVFPHLLSDTIGTKLGFVEGIIDATGTTNSGSQLAAAIAYSALDSGNMIYGNTGIRGLFDDSNDLGYAIQRSSADSSADPLAFDGQTVAYLGQIVANFAGLLATERMIANTSDADPEQWTNAWFLDGILGWNHEGGSLSVDLSRWTWEINEQPNNIVSRDEFVHHVFEASGVSNAALLSALDWAQFEVGYEGSYSDAIGSITFDFFGTTNSAPNAYPQYDTFNVLFARADGSGADAAIHSGYMILVGSEYGEWLIGGVQSDILFGLDGNDVLIGGEGPDWFVGGAGSNQIFGNTLVNPYFDQDYDTVWYDPNSPLTVFVRPFEDGPLVANNDELYSIERIIASSYADVFNFEGYLTQNLDIDAQHNAVGLDTIDFSGWDGSVSYFANDEAAEFSDSGYQVKVLNFKGVLVGSDSDDAVHDSSVYFKNIMMGDGNDFVAVSNASSYVFGGAGNDYLSSVGSGHALLVGGSGNDIMEGGDGADLIVMNEGDIRASGGAGHDRFILQAASVETVQFVAGGEGNDYVQVRANTQLNYTFESGHDLINLTTDTSLLELTVAGLSSDFSIVFRVESKSFEHYVNNGTQALWRATGDLLLYSYDQNDTLIIENFGMWFSTLAGYNSNDISTEDLASYSAINILFDDGFVEVYGSAPGGQNLQHYGLLFDVTSDYLGDFYSAEFDFFSARIDEPQIPYLF